MPVDGRVVEDLTFPCIISCVVGMEGHRTVESSKVKILEDNVKQS